MKANDPRLNAIAGTLQGIIASATLALKELGELRAESAKAEEKRSGLPPMAGRVGSDRESG